MIRLGVDMERFGFAPAHAPCNPHYYPLLSNASDVKVQTCVSVCCIEEILSTTPDGFIRQFRKWTTLDKRALTSSALESLTTLAKFENEAWDTMPVATNPIWDIRKRSIHSNNLNSTRSNFLGKKASNVFDMLSLFHCYGMVSSRHDW